MAALKKILPIFGCGIIFGLVMWNLEPPKSLTQATFWQIVLFFIPLFLLLTFLVNIFLGQLIKSLIISFGVILLLILKSLDMLNFISLLSTLLATFLIALSFKKRGLSQPSNIRSLKLRKQH